MEIFKQQNPFDIEIIAAEGTFLGVMEFTSVKELCQHLRHNNLPDGQVVVAGLDLRGGYLRQARLAGANLTNCNLEGVCLSGASLAGAIPDGANLNSASLKAACLRRRTSKGPASAMPMCGRREVRRKRCDPLA